MVENPYAQIPLEPSILSKVSLDSLRRAGTTRTPRGSRQSLRFPSDNLRAVQTQKAMYKLNGVVNLNQGQNQVAFAPFKPWLGITYGKQTLVVDFLHRSLSLLKCSEPQISLAFSPDNQTLATGSFTGWLRLWDLASKRESERIRVGIEAIKCLAYAQQQNCLVYSSGPHLRVLNLYSKQMVWSEQQPTSASGLAISPTSTWLASAGDLNHVWLWNYSWGKNHLKLYHHRSRTVAYSPQGDKIASSGYDGQIKLWHPQGHEIATYKTKGPVYSLCFHPAGQLLAAGTNNTIELWDTNSASQVAELIEYDHPVRSLGFSFDGTLIAAGGSSTQVMIWQNQTLNPLPNIPH